MKITHILVCALPFLMLGCKKKATPSASQPTPVVEMLPATKLSAPSSGWDKVKISDSGDIFVNKKQMSLADFSAECQRLKQAGGGAVLFIDAQHSQLNRAQIEAHQKLVDAGVGMKIVQKESDLE
jgi:biopolymer transport protein ExbD